MHAYVLWIAALSYALHVVEEYTFDWKTWATEVLHLPVSWTHFALVNGVVVVLGVSCSSVGWALPAFSLSLPAQMLINATFMHVLWARRWCCFFPSPCGLTTEPILMGC